MKITPLTIDFDVTNEREVAFVNELMNRLFGGAPLKAMPAPTENPVNSTSVPTFSEPTQTAAPVQEFKKEANPEAIAEAKKKMEKPEKVAEPKTVKEAPQATVEPEPVQAPTKEEKVPEKASKEPLTEKDMQKFMMDLMRAKKITGPQLTDIMLELGGASLMRIKPEQYELLKQRIEEFIKEKPEKSKTVKEAPQATIEPEPVQAPTEEEKAPEKASNEPLTAKDMQAFMMDMMRADRITRSQLTDIMLEFGGTSLMRIKPEKYELLKQRIETYND